MFLRRPDLAYKYPKRMYEQLGETIFSEKNKESVYYAAALALYRFHLLRSNGIVAKNLGRVKWHLIALVAELIGGAEAPELNSKAAEKYASKLIDVLSKHETSVPYFKQAAAAAESLAPITDDRLKRAAILEEMRAKLVPVSVGAAKKSLASKGSAGKKSRPKTQTLPSVKNR